MHYRIRTLLTTLLAAGLIAVSPLSYSDPADPASQPGQGQATSVDSSTLKTFADAFSGVNEIQQEYTQKLSEAGSEDDAKVLQQQAQNEMIGVIEDHGMSVPEYNDVANAIEQDPALREEFMSMIGSPSP